MTMHSQHTPHKPARRRQPAAAGPAGPNRAEGCALDVENPDRLTPARGHFVGFSCHPRSLTPVTFTRWPAWLLATMVKNDLWISLKPDEARETGAVHA
jgi:hypothetical protein